MTLCALLDGLRSGEVALLAWIDQLEARFDEREADVRAFVPEDGRFARLRHEAAQLLRAFPDPAARPPLFGLPVGVKDIFHVNGFTTRAGSRLPPELLQGVEAECVRQLRRDGALIVGKTVTTEFAYFAPGPTRNPRRLDHTPGGSSSGSAAAVAAGLCALALGTQTIGSIIRPAAFCGVVGFKPTFGRLSTAGVIPLSPSLDHVGLFAGDVAGAAAVAARLCREWQNDLTPSNKPILGIPEGPYLDAAEPEGLAHLRQDCDRLSDAGFIIRPVAALPDFADVRRHHLALMAAEAADTHTRWFDQYEALYHPRTAELIRRGRAVGNEERQAALAYQRLTRQHLLDLMTENGLDVWLCPPAPAAAPQGLDSTGDPVMNLPWTFAGLPALTLPTGVNGAGLPLGLQLVIRLQEDERLLRHAQLIEGAFGHSYIRAHHGNP